MAKSGAPRPGPRRQGNRPLKANAAKKKTPRPPRATAPVAPTPAPPPGPFRLGVIPGATPGKWIDLWQQRMPHTPLELVPLLVADQRAALDAASVDAAIVRRPIDAEGLHVIPLYDEVPVVVCDAESHLTAAEDLTLADLAGEIVITPLDDVLHIDVPGAVIPDFTPPDDAGQAIETVAAGVGIVIVPMSLARLHQRRDVAYRPLRDGPLSPVALAWPVEATTELVETFVGIVRGRTAHSSRG
ncbi:LysR family substrate-binding domain-containing protein [Microbacterium sp. Sa4CUA7]|uniref:LysR family substrate-binding domain-containing protein n=1 Tax=Microbacterium pullorum TaxID=2762236 RepID=A0ABR8S3Z9_9MICO|nr:LysR family substrate-binding domain-containing protein [Microbacterium pullorum]MBD7958209.1 LysR family substrate-binding domain-containing protein [Microbacterium pullorum]